MVKGKTMFNFDNEKFLIAFKSLLDCISDGIFITDGDGKVLFLNKASENICKYEMKELIGKNVNDMVKDGMFEDSLCLQAIKEGRKVSEMQIGVASEKDILATAVPLFENNNIKMVICTERDVTEIRHMHEELEKLEEKYQERVNYYNSFITQSNKIIHASDLMKDICETVKIVAPTDVPILIEGESGTGKSLIAKSIFEASSNTKAPYIEVNCGAIPENLIESELFGYEKGAFTGASDKGKAGLFEIANGGTIFLDEIGELPYTSQAKLLRVIQESEVMRVGGLEYIPINVRVIAATNKDMKQSIENGEFRSDLYYRLSVFSLKIPPLRERRDDIIPLQDHFIAKYNKKYHKEKKLMNSALNMLLRYDWPGNIRELENIIERVVVISKDDKISAESIRRFFPMEISAEITLNNGAKLKDVVDDYERSLIMASLNRARTVEQLAEIFGIDKSTISRKLKKYNLSLK